VITCCTSADELSKKQNSHPVRNFRPVQTEKQNSRINPNKLIRTINASFPVVNAVRLKKGGTVSQLAGTGIAGYADTIERSDVPVPARPTIV